MGGFYKTSGSGVYSEKAIITGYWDEYIDNCVREVMLPIYSDSYQYTYHISKYVIDYTCNSPIVLDVLYDMLEKAIKDNYKYHYYIVKSVFTNTIAIMLDKSGVEKIIEAKHKQN